jgi:uncharacterized protein YvpB
MLHHIHRHRHPIAAFVIALIVNAIIFYNWPTVESLVANWFSTSPIYAGETIINLPEGGIPDSGFAPEGDTPRATPTSLPASYQIENVPYTVQAPYAQWSDDTYQNGCEEAALLMVHKYWQKSALDADIATQEIKEMVEWQKSTWGSHFDLSVWKLVDFANEYLGTIYQSSIYRDPSWQNLKYEIAQGRPVIVPVMSHSLDNPHYGRNDAYHMLVITGYDETGFVTNDPGVKEGYNWHYTYETMAKAMSAQVEHIPGQGKVALVLYPM